ncbi:MAG TPA: amidohydrolase family protein [Candidatus Baltobacteraceae bacterium]|nr:amidohydrolase family protein [Candidatus Baltobacteraceae bacterium]
MEGSSKLVSAGVLAAGAIAGDAAGAGSIATEAAGQPQAPKKKYRLIATEEAFAIPEQVDEFRKIASIAYSNPDLDMWRNFLNPVPNAPPLVRRLLDLEGERIQIMDEAGVDMHLLSLTSPGVQMFDKGTATSLATLANDRLAEVIKKHPTRFTGLASFAPQDPARAAKEIDRAMNQLKLNGLIVNSHTDGEYLDNKKYWPIFEAAVASKAAIYIHPRNMPDPCSFMTRADVNLAGAIWGFQMETGLHAMRLIVAGVFDQFPDLKIILGHMGEGVPYWLYRIDYMYKAFTHGHPPLKKLPSDYVKENFVITTSGMNDHKVLKYCYEALGAENIIYAIDYPYQESVESANFMQSAPLPEEDMEKITHGNSEKLFHIPPA